MPPASHRPPTARRVAATATVLLGMAVFVLALIPLKPPPPVPGTDKLHHLVGFAALTLPCAALCPRLLIAVLPAIVAEAALIEIVQPYVNRMREWADVVADLKGVGVGLMLGFGFRSALALRRSAET